MVADSNGNLHLITLQVQQRQVALKGKIDGLQESAVLQVINEPSLTAEDITMFGALLEFWFHLSSLIRHLLETSNKDKVVALLFAFVSHLEIGLILLVNIPFGHVHGWLHQTVVLQDVVVTPVCAFLCPGRLVLFNCKNTPVFTVGTIFADEEHAVAYTQRP